jgi:hypothetical protein
MITIGDLMTRRNFRRFPARGAAICALALAAATAVHAADVVRHSNNSNFPIARAVEVPAGKTLYFHSGMTPAPLDAKAKPGLG